MRIVIEEIKSGELFLLMKLLERFEFGNKKELFEKYEQCYNKGLQMNLYQIFWTIGCNTFEYRTKEDMEELVRTGKVKHYTEIK